VGGNFGGGTIYQLTPPATAGGTWSENTLYQFTYYGPDGGAPVGVSGGVTPPANPANLDGGTKG